MAVLEKNMKCKRANQIVKCNHLNFFSTLVNSPGCNNTTVGKYDWIYQM